MPEGQFTGARAVYEYISDNAAVYLLQMDETIGSLSELGLTKATTDTTGIPAPKRFKPRGVYWQGELDSKVRRKFLVCSSTSSLFQSDNSSELTIDGVQGSTTGRTGESLSFLRLEAPAA